MTSNNKKYSISVVAYKSSNMQIRSKRKECANLAHYHDCCDQHHNLRQRTSSERARGCKHATQIQFSVYEL